MTITPEPTTLPAVADRAGTVATDLRRLTTGDRPPTARDLVDLTAEVAAITLALLEAALPSVDDDEPGTGEALERAAELNDDARRHLVTAFHLVGGVHTASSPLVRTGSKRVARWLADIGRDRCAVCARGVEAVLIGGQNRCQPIGMTAVPGL